VREGWKKGNFMMSSKAIAKNLDDDGWGLSEVNNDDLEFELGVNPIYFQTKNFEVKLRKNKSALEI